MWEIDSLAPGMWWKRGWGIFCWANHMLYFQLSKIVRDTVTLCKVGK